ncbi:hypothetical protein [Sediminicoccus sp. KRV36]|uniref:hypothetical protein n=1 Tax=Sediminicoccus sp. KRV36 TaxID=3133721 RepID=UPI00200BBC4C|nr:hypothetical protein [Sediminicoccus rosea]UPY35382.1 hypothetical protein LHU95_14260 [Sediminicoccus rosea]
MTRPLRDVKAFLALAALLTGAACSGTGGQEPLYVLRDSLGRSVAMAGRSQLGDAAPGTMVRANIGGTEQDVMVGERVGLGPVMRPAPAGADPGAAPMTSEALAAPPLAAPAVASAPAEAPARTRRARAATTGTPVTGATPTGRRREAPPRSVSRSVM